MIVLPLPQCYSYGRAILPRGKRQPYNEYVKGGIVMQTERLKVREKIAYGVGDLGNNVAYGALGFYFVFFLTDVAGLSPFWAGNIFMIVRMWNAVLDMVVGGLSDHTKTRHGRRRPYLLYGALPLGVAFALLWQVFFVGEVSMIVFYIFAGVLFSTMFKTIGAPQKWLTPWLAIAPHTASPLTWRRQTLVPATAASVHGKHQPLQWNIGSVHRYTGWRGMPVAMVLA